MTWVRTYSPGTDDPVGRVRADQIASLYVRSLTGGVFGVSVVLIQGTASEATLFPDTYPTKAEAVEAIDEFLQTITPSPFNGS